MKEWMTEVEDRQVTAKVIEDLSTKKERRTRVGMGQLSCMSDGVQGDYWGRSPTSPGSGRAERSVWAPLEAVSRWSFPCPVPAGSLC